jgi:hypothetical protein
LIAYLSDFDTNQPVEGAALDLVARRAGRAVWQGRAAATSAPGVYLAPLTLPDSGLYSLVVSVRSGNDSARFALSGLEARTQEAGVGTRRRWWPWAAGAAVLVIAGLVLVALWRRQRTVLASLLALGLLAISGPAGAHEGHDEAPVAAGLPVAPGVTVHLPKESQFLLGVRTRPAAVEWVQRRVEVMGRVAPRGGSEIEIIAPQTGRILFPGGRPRVIGEAIGRDQVVGHLVVVDSLTLRAPQRGTVTGVHVAHGQIVQAGQRILSLLDPATVWVHADVLEPDLASVASSHAARITTPAYPGEAFPGRRMALGVATGEVPGAIEAWFEVPNPAGKLRVGALVSVGIESGDADSAVVIPRSAVFEKGGRRLAFVHLAPERFSAREVTEVTVLGDRVAIRGDIARGERVVISGGFQLLSAPVVGQKR